MRESKQDDRGSARIGRLLMALIGLCLVLVGVLFIFLMGRSYLRAKEMRSWPTIPCVILESSIEERQHDPHSPLEFSHRIAYAYEWGDQQRVGKRISLRGIKWSSKREAAVESFERYPPGTIAECHVNPVDPQLSVLETDSLAPLYSIWFPALFMVGGIGMLLTCFRPHRARISSRSSP